MSLIKQVHPVRLRKVHHGRKKLTNKIANLKINHGKFPPAPPLRRMTRAVE
jgi:hypothetical protein